MAKYEKRHAQSNDKNIEQAQKLAKANQRPGQTKEQTKIIAQVSVVRQTVAKYIYITIVARINRECCNK